MAAPATGAMRRAPHVRAECPCLRDASTWRACTARIERSRDRDAHHMSSSGIPEDIRGPIERRSRRPYVIHDHHRRWRHRPPAQDEPQRLTLPPPLITVAAGLPPPERRSPQESRVRHALTTRQGDRQRGGAIRRPPRAARMGWHPGDDRAAREARRRQLREEQIDDPPVRAALGAEHRPPHRPCVPRGGPAGHAARLRLPPPRDRPPTIPAVLTPRQRRTWQWLAATSARDQGDAQRAVRGHAPSLTGRRSRDTHALRQLCCACSPLPPPIPRAGASIQGRC